MSDLPRDPPPILGIDIGTSTCLACVMQGERPLFIRPDLAFPQGDPYRLAYPSILMPSAFCNRDGQALVGHRALNELTHPAYADDVVISVKRFMKRDRTYRVKSGDREYAPSQVAGEFVKALVCAAERQLKLPPHTIEEAVVTVPAYFGSAELEATRRACLDYGGLAHVWLLDEPVAAAYSLGLHDQPGAQTVLVADLGGGTFDVTLLRVGTAIHPIGFEELGRDGDAGLGGQDWDREIAEWVVGKTLEDAPEPERERLLDGRNYGNSVLSQACERAKHEFFEGGRETSLPDMLVTYRPTPDARPLDAVVPGRWFFDQAQDLVEQCVDVCERLFRDVAALDRRPFGWDDLDCVYMAGGGSNMWTVRRRIAQCWGRAPVLNERPQYAVAEGAARCAQALRAGKKLAFLGRPRYPHTIGVMARDPQDRTRSVFQRLIRRNAPIPFRETFWFPAKQAAAKQGPANLNIRIVEKKFGRAGDIHEDIQTVVLRDLPPAEDGQPEKVGITVECDANGILSFAVAFRGRDLTVDVDGLIRRAASRVGGRSGQDQA